MPRLVHLLDYVPRGTRTIDHSALALTQALVMRGWEVRFVFAHEPPAAFRDELTQTGAISFAVQFPFTRQSARDLKRRLNGFRPDILMTSFISPFNLALLSLKIGGFTRRLVILDHASGTTPARRGWKRILTQLRGRLAGRVIDAILPVSHANARRAIERVYLPANKVKVIPNGIRLELFPAPTRPIREKVRVVYAGQLIPEKGVLTLLKAHEQLRNTGMSDYELLIAGAGAQADELRAFCQTAGLDDVQFLGHVDSVPELLGSADIVVVPSEWAEAFGLVVAEAMACGAACLVSDAGALPEVVGEAGIVFRAGDTQDLASKLSMMISNDAVRQNLGQAAHLHAQHDYDIKDMIQSYVDVIIAEPKGSTVTQITTSEEVPT